MQTNHDDAVIMFDLICRFCALTSFSGEETIAILQAKILKADFSHDQLSAIQRLIKISMEQ